MSNNSRGPISWAADSDMGKVLRGLMVTCKNYEEITNIINNTFATDYTIEGIRSAAYRQGLSISNREAISNKAVRYQEKYGMKSWDSIPTYTIENDNREWVPICPFGDLHVGNDNFLEDVLDTYIEYWNFIDGHTFAMGDMLETALATSIPGAIWDQRITPREQAKYVRNKVLKIKNLMGSTPGNHEGRIIKATDLDPMEFITEETESMYMRRGGLLNVRVGEIDYMFMFKHGGSFAKDHRKEVESYATLYPVADVIALGHVHVNEVFRVNERFDVSFEGGDMKRKAKFQIGVRTGHALGYGGYLEERPYKPHDTGFPIIWINSKEKRMHWDDAGTFATDVKAKEMQ